MIGSKGYITRFGASILAFGFLLSSVFLFGPLDIYLSHAGEFSRPFSDLLLSYTPVVLILLAGFSAVLALFKGTVHTRILAVILAVGFCLLLQGGLLRVSYGPLDGTDLDFEISTWRIVLEFLVWLGLVGLAALRPGFFVKNGFFLAIVLVLVQSVYFAINLLSSESTSSEVMLQADAVDEGIFRLSETRNVIHIVMDEFQSDIFQELLRENEAWTNELAGFDFFQNHASNFATTHFSMGAQLTSRIYRNNEPFKDFLGRAHRESAYHKKLFESGFDITLYTVGYLMPEDGYCEDDNVLCHRTIISLAKEDANHSRDLATLLDVSLFRHVPHVVKPYVYNDQSWLFALLLTEGDSDYVNFHASNASVNIDYFSENLFVSGERPQFLLYHNIHPHLPLVVDRNCQFIGKQDWSDEGYVNQAHCALSKTIKFLRRLKTLDVYDDALIILTSDHGVHWIPSRAVRAVLAIKRPGADHPFRISDRPTSGQDIPATMTDLLDLDGDFSGLSVYSDHFPADRERHYGAYRWGREVSAQDYLPYIDLYSVRPSLQGDDDYLTLEATLLPPGEVSDPRGDDAPSIGSHPR